jgi:hypothetical protein
MEDKQANDISSAVPVFVGILLAIAAFSLAVCLVILLFGELGDLSLALNGGTLLAVLSAMGYGIAELLLYPRVKRKSLLAIVYFLTFAILATLLFCFTAASPLFGAFLGNEDLAKALLRILCSRLCAANAVALFLRIILEIIRYVKSLRSP